MYVIRATHIIIQLINIYLHNLINLQKNWLLNTYFNQKRIYLFILKISYFNFLRVFLWISKYKNNGKSTYVFILSKVYRLEIHGLI
jgi:hypothetical protein